MRLMPYHPRYIYNGQCILLFIKVKGSLSSVALFKLLYYEWTMDSEVVFISFIFYF